MSSIEARSQGKHDSRGTRAMQRSIWIDAAILAVGVTFILYVVAEGLQHPLMALGVLACA